MKHFVTMFFSIFCLSSVALTEVVNVPGDQPTIQAGINAAVDGDTVLVSDGLYIENINFKGKAITVASYFLINGESIHIDSTIIDGSQPLNPDSGSVVYLVSGEDTTSILMGFTITNGSGTKMQYTFEGNKYNARVGGGICCWNTGGRFVSNKIINNTISDETDSWGGGVVTGDIGNDTWVIIENNRIINNTVNGVYGPGCGGGVSLSTNGKLVDNIISYNSCIATEYEAWGGGIEIITTPSLPCTVIIKGNRINHNLVQGKGTTDTEYWAAEGGGIRIWYSQVLILDNEICYNQLKDFGNGIGSGGGIYMRFAADGSAIKKNIISDNSNELTDTNYGGGISLSSCIVPVHNNIISGNSATHGGGIRLKNNHSEIINNTIVNNTASISGGGLFSTKFTPELSNPVVINTILWDNQSGIGSQISGEFHVCYSDIQGGDSGTGNINTDPLFLDTLSYELSELSPCVGAGIHSIQINGTWYNCPATDYNSDVRPNPIDYYVDIGAVESSFEPTDIEDRDPKLPLAFDLKQNYPNPFNPSTTIEFSLPISEFVTLKIYNILGKEVATLVYEKLTPGSYTYTWNASDIASGIYFYRIETTKYRRVKKMIVLQ